MYRTSWISSLLVAVLALALFPAAIPAQTFLGKGPIVWSEKLTSSDAAERRNGAFALGKLGEFGKGSMPQLILALKQDSDPAVKEAAAFAIGEICKVSVEARSVNLDLMMPVLKDALTKDPDDMVRRSAAYALGCLGKDAANALAELNNALNDKNPAVRQNAAWALGKVGKASVLALRKALTDGDSYVVREAANSLAEVGPAAREALSELLAQINHKDLEVRKSVVLALVQAVNSKDGASVAQHFKKIVENQRENPEVRVNAALALGNIGGPEASSAIPILVDVLSNGTLDRKQQAAAVIGNMGANAKDAIPALRKALYHPDIILKKNAAVSLGGIGKDASSAVLDLVNLVGNTKETTGVREAAAVALKDIGPCPEIETDQAVNILINVLGDRTNSPDLRAVAMWTFRFHKNVANYSNLFDVLNKILQTEARTDQNKMLRYDSAYMLGKYKKSEVNDKVMDTLLEFLKDPKVFIYVGSGGEVKGSGEEKGPGGSNVKKKGEGDGRVIAVQALIYIANEGAGGNKQKVLNRPDIMQQVLELQRTSSFEPLQKVSKSLLDYLSK